MHGHIDRNEEQEGERRVGGGAGAGEGSTSERAMNGRGSAGDVAQPTLVAQRVTRGSRAP